MRFALVGDVDDDVREAVTAADADVVDHDSNPDAVLACGESALRDVALDGSDAPVLPVSREERHYAVARRDVAAAVRALVAGHARTVDHPVMSLSVGDEDAGRALFDVTLVTSQTAKISEYGVGAPDGRIDEFRADGVVVASPVGSAGYARAANGSLLLPGTGLAVVPISPFTTQTDTWVVPEEVTLSVERDEGRVSLLADRDERAHVRPDEPVSVTTDESVSLLRVRDGAQR